MRVLGLNAPTTAEPGKRPGAPWGAMGRHAPPAPGFVARYHLVGGLEHEFICPFSWIPSFWLVGCLDFLFFHINWEFHTPN